MPDRRGAREHDIDDEGPEMDRDEGPSAEDIERFSGVTRTCPECKTELYDDAELCWKCGHALHAVGDGKGPPIWVVVTTVVLLASIAVYFVT